MAHKCGNKHNSNQQAESQKTEQAAAQEADIHPYYKKVQENPSDYPDSLILRYERSACFGTCPVDVIEIFKSGYLAYTPFMHGGRDTISSAFIAQDEIFPFRGPFLFWYTPVCNTRHLEVCSPLFRAP